MNEPIHETATPGLSSSQTIGPFFRYGLAWTNGEQAFPPGAPGEHIEVTGTVTDGAGTPIVDSMIEFWQADASGTFGGPTPGSCAGFARCYTDSAGRYTLNTVKPGAVPGPNGKPAAPHILVCMFSRGMLAQVYTHVYFAADANDPTQQAIGPRINTLIARQTAPAKYEWNIVLQGEHETVFLDF